MAVSLFKKSEQIYWLWLSLKLNNQNAIFQKLLDVFEESSFNMYDCNEAELSKVEGITERQKALLMEKDLSEAMHLYNYCKRNGIGLITYSDPEYPQNLKELKKPPIVLYYMGRLPDLNNRLCISMVGTRKMTEYGMRSCYKIAYELAAAGAVIISGMALGIDSVAHAGAIGGRGETVAVLGCGIDVVYPKQHRKLRRYICEHGAVITAYHPSTPAYKNNFPERNAIISALSSGTIIVEAPARSGALITAECAEEQAKKVYALPGSIEEPMSEGPNTLIKNGAIAITSARDILNYYFETGSPLVDSIKLRKAEINSDFDIDILADVGVSANCHGVGPKSSPAALLQMLNDEIKNNKENNEEYYSVPKIRKIGEDSNSEEKKEVTHKKEVKEIKETKKNTPAPVDESVIASLTDEQRNIFNEMPCDKPVSVDQIAKGGYNISTLMASLTILEIKGLISSLPGGMYIRK